MKGVFRGVTRSDSIFKNQMTMNEPSAFIANHDRAFASVLSELLMQFNAQASAYRYDGQPLAIHLVAGEEGAVIGGLLGSTSYRYLHIDAVFVPDHLRGTGIGRKMVLMAETEAEKRGCVGAWLDTFSFQARGFYEKLGYSLLGELPDNPPGHTRFFFRKKLTPTPIP